MTLDVRGSLKNTKLSKNALVVFEELFSNAIDAFLIRKNSDTTATALDVSFSVEIRPRDLIGEEFDVTISCKDNGIGFGDEQAKAFLTKDTSYKDDLAIAGIGQCKGSGRIQYFHHFGNIKIVSGFVRDGRHFRRTLEYNEAQKELDQEDFPVVPRQEIVAGLATIITLSALRQSVRDRVFVTKYLPEIFGANRLKHHLLVSFMQRLVGLGPQLGVFKVEFKVITTGNQGVSNEQAVQFGPDDLPKVTDTKSVTLRSRPKQSDSY